MLTNEELPPLPKARMLVGKDLNSLQVLYTPDQMREYGRAVERAAYKAAIEACRDESVDAVATGSNEDRAYNAAIEHCADAISALIPKEPK